MWLSLITLNICLIRTIHYPPDFMTCLFILQILLGILNSPSAVHLNWRLSRVTGQMGLITVYRAQDLYRCSISEGIGFMFFWFLSMNFLMKMHWVSCSGGNGNDLLWWSKCIHPFIHSNILVKPLLYVGYYFRCWKYGSDDKKIKSLSSWRLISSEERQTKKFKNLKN